MSQKRLEAAVVQIKNLPLVGSVTDQVLVEKQSGRRARSGSERRGAGGILLVALDAAREP